MRWVASKRMLSRKVGRFVGWDLTRHSEETFRLLCNIVMNTNQAEQPTVSPAQRTSERASEGARKQMQHLSISIDYPVENRVLQPTTLGLSAGEYLTAVATTASALYISPSRTSRGHQTNPIFSCFDISHSHWTTQKDVKHQNSIISLGLETRTEAAEESL